MYVYKCVCVCIYIYIYVCIYKIKLRLSKPPPWQTPLGAPRGDRPFPGDGAELFVRETTTEMKAALDAFRDVKDRACKMAALLSRTKEARRQAIRDNHGSQCCVCTRVAWDDLWGADGAHKSVYFSESGDCSMCVGPDLARGWGDYPEPPLYAVPYKQCSETTGSLDGVLEAQRTPFDP